MHIARTHIGIQHCQVKVQTRQRLFWHFFGYLHFQLVWCKWRSRPRKWRIFVKERERDREREALFQAWFMNLTSDEEKAQLWGEEMHFLLAKSDWLTDWLTKRSRMQDDEGKVFPLEFQKCGPTKARPIRLLQNQVFDLDPPLKLKFKCCPWSLSLSLSSSYPFLWLPLQSKTRSIFHIPSLSLEVVQPLSQFFIISQLPSSIVNVCKQRANKECGKLA